ncbi:low specificity L-threonine aldolase [Roseovarius sp. A21]|uniref:Low specificity L-threonine aldolase n=1 Tax=Roseovarius bejariae TaxID=2576383 RepID=A0A844CNE4_9RHOB|nr:beta-eliminating lyase-related protein [Roseovarius bejariae]MRU16122.1 low specificity L-threonine aldolase [Roseovarius bejariae]
MSFKSDNCGPAHPAIIEALTTANQGFAPSYGTDDLTARTEARLRDIFEAPEASVHLVATGTAANSLALSTLTQPWQTIFCTPLAHIHTDECHAPEFYTGGAKLSLVGEGDKMTPEALQTAIEGWTLGDVHCSQRGPVALTQVTEMGRVYSLEELAALTQTAARYDLPVHLDGARFANALVALDCTPAEMTWKAGIDAVSFGGTKNGCLGVEAVIFFNPAKAWEFELRRKRAAHLFSKHRFLAAQMLAYLTDDLWLDMARAANAKAARLAEGLRGVPDCVFLAEPQANMIFATLPRATHQRLMRGGAHYGLNQGPLDTGAPDEPLSMRLVCDWSIPEDAIDHFVTLAKGD